MRQDQSEEQIQPECDSRLLISRQIVARHAICAPGSAREFKRNKHSIGDMRFDRSKCLRADIRSIRLIALGTALDVLAEPMPPADRDPFNLKAAELDANEVRCLALTLYWEARPRGAVRWKPLHGWY